MSADPPGISADQVSLPVREIGVAIVLHDDRVLVGVRGEGGPLAGYAEFPGGKCEPAETPDQCAVRECLEESGLEVAPVRCLLSETHTYSHGTVRLHFWLCRPKNAEDLQRRHRAFFWVSVSELANWRFPEGNRGVVEILMTSAPET